LKRLFRLLIITVLLSISSACSKETLNGSSSASPGSNTTDPIFSGPDPNQGLDVRKMASDANSYAITYGTLDAAAIQTLKTYPVVIVHPYGGNITRTQIYQIKQGQNPDDPSDNVVVLCYISIGEDSRTFGLTDEQMKADPRFVGDGSGPSIDPRGAAAGGTSLRGVNPLGTPTNGGFASYYVNDNAVTCNGAADKKPDINNIFKTRFINAGDPLWYSTLNDMIMDESTRTPPGLKELLTNSNGRGLGCDGVFLDTIDTAAPNNYTNCSDENHSKSEWTAPGFATFMRRLRSDYPDKVILQNRGLFFFDPREPHYQVSARGAIDIGFFESYRLDNDSSDAKLYFLDNKYNTAPKLMAEANRPDGFKMLSLGYANGFDAAKPGIDIQTLLSTTYGIGTGFSELYTDMQEAHAVGFRHYLTSATVDFVNSFVKKFEDMSDLSAPVWSSVYNVNYGYPDNTLDAPVSRIGIQQAFSTAPGNVTLKWDVALDMNKVSYVLYYKKSLFDFVTDPALVSAARIVLNPSAPLAEDEYANVWNSGDRSMSVRNQSMRFVYPYQQTISGFEQGVTHYFLIRARDSKGNEDSNQVVLTATP
jgi:hypothetical protein